MASYKKTITLGLDYSEFEGGIKACNEEMKNLDAEFKLASAQMENTGSKSDKLALKQDYLAQKINLQAQKVEEAKKKYNALMDAHADTSKIQAADRALLRERTELQNLENQMERTRLESSGLKESMAALSAVVVSVSALFFKGAKDVANYADDILTASNNAHISAQTLQEWQYAANFVDVEASTVTSSLTKLTKTMGTASKGIGDSATAFRKLHVSIKDAHGQMRDSEDVFYDVIDALGRMTNETERDQYAMQIFGKSASELNGIINIGSDAFKEYGKEAEKLGIILSDDELEKAGKLKDSMDKLQASMASLGQHIGLVIVPALTKLFEAIASIPQPILQTITVILSIVVTIVTLVSTVNSAVKAGSSIVSMFTSWNDPINKATIIILGVVAAITALVIALNVLFGKSQQTVNAFNAMGSSAGGMVPGQRTGHNASGTKSWRGGATWVGENGPEIVDVPAGSRIYNNNEVKQMGGNTYNINMNMDITKLKSVSDVVDAVMGIRQTAECGGSL